MSTNKKYINPTPISLTGKILKLTNIQIIENYCETNNISPKQKKEIYDRLLKPNNYYPTVIQKKNKEKLQCIGIN